MVDFTEYRKQIGTQYGNYRLMQFLDLNKDVAIYGGQHIHLNTLATIHLYPPLVSKSDQENFEQEANVLAHLVHPHISRILEAGVENHRPFLVMAYRPGIPLHQHYPTGSIISWPVLLAYTGQIASALDYMHQQRLLYLALQPKQIWLLQYPQNGPQQAEISTRPPSPLQPQKAYQGKPNMSGGFASGPRDELVLNGFRVLRSNFVSRSENILDVVDTTAYMSPEQIQGHPVPASDQYALGILVYEWLSGARPFQSNNYIDLAKQHLSAPPPALFGRVAGFSPSIEQVIMQALHKEPEQRFSSVSAFSTALAQSYTTPHASVQNGISAESRRQEKGKRGFSRRAMVFSAAGIAGVAAVGIGISQVITSPTPSIPQKLPKKVKPIAAGTTLHTYSGHVDNVYGVDWSRDGQKLASWSFDDTMQIWNANTFSQQASYAMASVLAWSPNWRYLASGSRYNFQLWEQGTGRILIDHEVPNTGAGPGNLAVGIFVRWSPDGKAIATAQFDLMQVWDVATGKMLFSYPRSYVAWSPDGKQLALMAFNYTGTNQSLKLQILDVATESQVRSYTVPGNIEGTLSWSPDGKYLAASDGTIWNALSGKMLFPQGQIHSLGALSWSLNSRYLATFDPSQSFPLSLVKQEAIKADTTVHIWDVLTGKELLVYREHTGGVNDVAWSPDSTRIASASADMTVKVWQVVSN